MAKTPKTPVTSKRGKSAWVANTLTGDKKVVTGRTTGGLKRASAVHNAQRSVAMDASPGPSRSPKSKYKTGDGF